MVECNHCNQEMLKVDTCTATHVDYPDGKSLEVSTFHFNEDSGKCHDCGIKHGGVHHPGCDVEQCPKCEGQLISCGCLDEEEEKTMKIIKKGTFNERGVPTGWHLDACGATDDPNDTDYGLGIFGDKVCVNGVEIVEWTEERRRCMSGTTPD